MQIYNSLTNKKEEFKTIEENKLQMYVCGPTVYDYIHIGNLRPVVFFDVVRRYFEFIGYDVTYASNVTDVDDKIIKKALESHMTEKEVASKFASAFFHDSLWAGSKKPNVIPYATEYIEKMIDFILRLVEKGAAYEKDGDVYFRVSSIPTYGVLSNQKTESLEAGARISVEEKKESPLDFTLWKKTNEGIQWDSPWGLGRPGWHTECVVMIDTVFGHKIDIHGGGVDLKFPHHENEIAQACAQYNHTLANTWMHVGRIGYKNEKMSKSLGNIISAKDLFEKYDPRSYRMLLLSSQYRTPIDFTYDLMDQFKMELEKVERSLRQAFIYLDLNGLFTKEYDETILNEFKKNMDDDFNTANVMTLIQDTLKKLNVELRSKGQMVGKYYHTLITIEDVLGISFDFKPMDEETKSEYKAWEEARKVKDFAKADQYRQVLVSKGIL